MPGKLSRRDRVLLLSAGGGFVLLIVLALILSAGSQTQEEYPTSYSAASGGAKAAYLLLSESGFGVQRWEKRLSDLPGGVGKTLVLAEPQEAPTTEERERLRGFISEGGLVIATGRFGGTFLPEDGAQPDPLAGMTWKKALSLSPSSITRAAPEITLAPGAYWRKASTAYRLYGDDKHTLVVKCRFGKGEVLWWASATPLTNAGLKESGNLEFFLASLGSRERQILWDEYIHGYRETLAASIAHSPVKWLLLQLALLAAAVVATFSRRSGPMLVPASEVRLSPIEFVQTLGGLYESAGAAAVAVDVCQRRFHYWLTRRLGVAGNTPIAELAGAVRDRCGFAEDGFEATLRQCQAAASDPYLQSDVALHLLQELDRYAERLHLFQGNVKEKRR